MQKVLRRTKETMSALYSSDFAAGVVIVGFLLWFLQVIFWAAWANQAGTEIPEIRAIELWRFSIPLPFELSRLFDLLIIPIAGLIVLNAIVKEIGDAEDHANTQIVFWESFISVAVGLVFGVVWFTITFLVLKGIELALCQFLSWLHILVFHTERR